MNAEEARRLSKKFLDNEVSKPFVDRAHERIKEFAKKGSYSCPHPFSGVDAELPIMQHQNAEEAAANILRAEGYKVVYHDNPDPGDPRSSSYWEVSW
jgi:hypothetical protein